MGTVPALLMVTILGITYGWQSDGRDGVEYIIQIPPSQLAEIERMGEVSSTIDPAVRGHVSRIVVRVGTDALPRETPTNLRLSADLGQGFVAQADHTPIPAPATDAPEPVLRDGLLASDQPARVMKPQNNGGFAMPSNDPNSAAITNAQVGGLSTTGPLRPGQVPVNNSATRATIAENPIGTGNGRLPLGDNGLRDPTANSASITVTPPSLQTNLLNSSPGLATTRPGGPSTDPVDSRSNPWRDLGTSSASNLNGAGPAPTNSGQTFNSTLPTTLVNPNPPNPSPTNSQTYPNSTFPNTTPYPTTNSFANGNSNSLSGTSNNPMAGNFVGESPTPSQGNWNAQTYQNNVSAGQLANNSQIGSPANLDSIVPISASRLSAAEIARLPPGTWGTDVYGRAYDRDGRLLNATGRPLNQFDSMAVNSGGQAGANGYPNRTGYPAARDSQAALIAAQNSNPLGTTFPQSPSDLNTNRPNRPATIASTQSGRMPSDGSADSRSPAPRSINSASSSADPSSNSASFVPQLRNSVDKSVAAQPLFNGLLLISLVANIYLIFWLRNLRFQFRDLVAAKRIAANNASS